MRVSISARMPRQAVHHTARTSRSPFIQTHQQSPISQVTRDGVSTRLIPSLDGGLYEFDGEDIKAIPMTAESLLSSSVRLTDNCVMVGGKEVGSYGVDVKTGQVGT